MPVPIMTVPTVSEKPTSFILPDLVSHCHFPLIYHPNGDAIAHESVTWLDGSCPDLTPKQRRALRGLQAGELTAYCYPTCSSERLRVVSDFMNYLFHLQVYLLFVCVRVTVLTHSWTEITSATG